MIFLSLAWWLSFLPCLSWADSPLSETAVIASAQRYYPLIKGAQAQVQLARANYLKAKGNFDPTLRSDLLGSAIGTYQNTYSRTELSIPLPDSGAHLFTGYRVGGGNFPVYDQNRETYELGEINMGIEFPLFRDKSIDPRRAQIAENKLKINMSQQDERLIKLGIEKEASIAYWAWYTEGKKLAIYTFFLNLAEKRQVAIKQSIALGDLPKADLYDNQRLILQRQALITNQKAVFEKAGLMLSLYYRNTRGEPIVPTVANLPLTLAKRQDYSRTIFDLYDIVNKTPAMEKLKTERELSNIQLSLAKNNLLPLLNSRIYVAQDFGGGTPPLNRSSINYQLIFQWPFFQRSAKGEIRAAQALLDQNHYQQQLEKEQTLVNIKATLAQLKALYDVIALSMKQLTLATKVQQAEAIRFREGESSLFILNEREVATAQAEIDYVSALEAYYIQKANLFFLMGTLGGN